MAKQENIKYLDAEATTFSKATQALLKEERKLYDELKSFKLKVTESMAKDMAKTLKAHEALLAHSYTRWGQLQVHIGEATKANGKVSKRMTLSEYLNT